MEVKMTDQFDWSERAGANQRNGGRTAALNNPRLTAAARIQ